MTARERNLAIAVGLLVGVLAVGYIWQQITGVFHRKSLIAIQLQDEIERKERTIQQGNQAQKEFERVRHGSLPAAEKLSLSRNNYHSWLLRSVQQANIGGALVKPMETLPIRPYGFQVLKYTVNGEGTIAQLSEWLSRFYALPRIHQIRLLTLTPQENRQIKLSATVEIMAMPTAQSADIPTDGAAESQVAEDPLAKAIVARNFFGPANRPPVLEAPASHKGVVGATIHVALKGADPDPGDTLKYRLVNGPEGAIVHADTGNIEWKPTENGTFPLEVAAVDNGAPPLETRKTIALEVVSPSEAPKETATAKLDDAGQAFLCASTTVDGRRQIWVHIRSTGKMLKLLQGDTLQVGDVEAVVGEIEERSANLNVAGRSVRLELGGKSLADSMQTTGG